MVCTALVFSSSTFAFGQYGFNVPVTPPPSNRAVTPSNVNAMPIKRSGPNVHGNTSSSVSEYQRLLSNLNAMQAVDSSSNTSQDWFVVGGMIPRRDGSVQVKFSKFQGETYVAQRVAEFVELNNNNCRYQIFGRVNDEKVAEDMVDDLVTARVRYNSKVRQARIATRQAELNRQRMMANSQSGGFGGYGGFSTYGGGGITGGGNCGSGSG